MRRLLRLLGLFFVGWLAFTVEAFLYLKLGSGPLDPNIGLMWAAAFFAYVPAFLLIVISVPGILVPEQAQRRWLRIVGGSLAFATAFAAPVTIFTSILNPMILVTFLMGLPAGAAIVGASLAGVAARNA